MAKNWTPWQKEAIERDDRDLCVSAGAGCGKTGTLVERFIRFVTRPIDPIRVDEILAITFTEKAAAEMKERVTDELRKRGLLAESRMVEHAHISTIHGLCTRLLREYPVEAGVDPRFGIQEEIADAIERSETLDELFETGLSNEPRAMQFLVSLGEKAARSAIETLYDDYRSRGWDPMATPLHIAEWPCDSSAIRESIDEFRAAALSGKPTDSVLKKLHALDGAQSFLDEISTHGCRSWDELSQLSAVEKAIGGNIGAAIRPAREALKEALGAARETFMASQSCELLEGLGRLVALFAERYDARKDARGVLDFEDLQLRARNLLRDHPAVRAELQGRFRRIMVDEFQDTNALQSDIINLLRGRDNLFIVGDVQQSIYRFRHAEVGIFREAIRTAREADPSGFIPLDANFRSRPEIIRYTNHIFRNLWKEEQDLFLPLNPQADYGDGDSGTVELLRISSEEAKLAPERRPLEARALAIRIEQLVESGAMVKDREGGLRPVRYGDFAILFRATTSLPIYEHELLERGIPFFTQSGRGFFERQEIIDLLSFLNVIDNPFGEISLAAVLRSPLVGISDSALLRLSRNATKSKITLYESFRMWRDISGISEDDSAKLTAFQALLDSLRRERDRLPVAEMLSRILAATAYEAHVLAGPLGRRKLANVRKLCDQARETADLHLSIREFVRYIQDLVTREAREGEALIEGERGDVVRLMTIHSAKGLEFPVVIVPDLHYGRRSSSNILAISPGGQVAIKIPNPLSGAWEKPNAYAAVALENDMAESAETERLLYVALTRARERLILSPLVEGVRSGGESFWRLMGGLLALEDSEDGIDGIHYPIQVRDPLEGDPAESSVARTRLMDQKPSALPKLDPQRQKELLQRVQLVSGEAKTGSRFTVTQLLTYAGCPKRFDLRYNWRVPEWSDGAESLEDLDPEGRELLPQSPLSELQMGQAAHKALEIYEFDGKPHEAIDSALSELGFKPSDDQKHRLGGYLRSVGESPLAERLRNPHWQEREFRFTIQLDGSLLIGAMDCFYEDAQGQVGIIDYKTNRIGAGEVEQIAQDYQLQTFAYALAAHQLTGIIPSWVSFYFLAPGKTHERQVTPELLEGARLQIGSVIRGIHDKDFHAVTSHRCRHCKFRGPLCKEGSGIGDALPPLDNA